MNHARPVVHFSAPECNLQMTVDNAGIILYEFPYEELSMAKYQEGRSKEKWYIWDNALMELMAKAGFAIITKEEPEAEVLDCYVKHEISKLDEEWSTLEFTT